MDINFLVWGTPWHAHSVEGAIEGDWYWNERCEECPPPPPINEWLTITKVDRKNRTITVSRKGSK